MSILLRPVSALCHILKKFNKHVSILDKHLKASKCSKYTNVRSKELHQINKKLDKHVLPEKYSRTVITPVHSAYQKKIDSSCHFCLHHPWYVFTHTRIDHFFELKKHTVLQCAGLQIKCNCWRQNRQSLWRSNVLLSDSDR